VARHILHISRGEESIAFLYVVVAVGAISTAMLYSVVAGLTWWQDLLMLIGSLILGWAILFSVLEVRRSASTPEDRAKQAFQEDYPDRIVVVDPPTGDPCPHHEDYPQSAGLDQGQLTSRIPDSTPFVDRFLNRPRGKKTCQ
jgi:hypothetical protein